jgi:hypothetical protein
MGCEAVRLQLADCKVSVDLLDSNRSFALHVLNRVPAVDSQRVPTGLAGFVASDNFPIAVLLHVLDGFCDEVEIFTLPATKSSNYRGNGCHLKL